MSWIIIRAGWFAYLKDKDPCHAYSRYQKDAIRFPTKKAAREALNTWTACIHSSWPPRIVRLLPPNRCRIGRPCPDHGFIHGAEAEELREAVESIIEEFEGVDWAEVDTVCGTLRAMLDRVDARDSLAFTEATQRQGTASVTQGDHKDG